MTVSLSAEPEVVVAERARAQGIPAEASPFRIHYRRRAVFYRGVEGQASFCFRLLYRRVPA